MNTEEKKSKAFILKLGPEWYNRQMDLKKQQI